MGAWAEDFISNDAFLDALAEFDESDPVEQVNFFNTLKSKAREEAANFKLSPDHLPMELPEDAVELLQLEQDLVNENQCTENREMFLGFIHHLIEKNIYQLLTLETLTDAQTFLKQLSHRNLLKGWKNPTARFNEIYQLQEKVTLLLRSH